MNGTSASGWEVREDRMYRSLIHFVLRQDDLWYVSLPCWGPYALIGIRHDDLPDFIQAKVEPNFRCYARSNINEENPLRLIFTDWELGLICVMCKSGTFSTIQSEGLYLPYLKCDHCGCRWDNFAEGQQIAQVAE